MKITITGINFNYDNGYDKEYTGVELQYIASGFKFTNNNPVRITKEQYEENKGSKDGLKILIINNILNDINNYVDDLNNFKEGLNA